MRSFFLLIRANQLCIIHRSRDLNITNQLPHCFSMFNPVRSTRWAWTLVQTKTNGIWTTTAPTPTFRACSQVRGTAENVFVAQRMYMLTSEIGHF